MARQGIFVIKEYIVEDGREVSLKPLEKEFVDRDTYSTIHENVPIFCHDVFINIDGGILLVRRGQHPAKGELWSVGGRLLRGVPVEDSLRRKAKEECGLEIRNIDFLGFIRTYFRSSEMNHEKGTDTPAAIFFAEGDGEVELDNHHDESLIVRPGQYTEEFRSSLHPYVRDFMDIVIQRVG